MDKKEQNNRRKKRKIKCLRKERTFSISQLEKEILQIQIRNNIKNIFIDNYPEGREVIFNEKKVHENFIFG